MKKRLLYIALFCIYIGAVLLLCLMKPDDIPQPQITFFGLPLDKVIHFLMFLPFPVLSFSIFYDRAAKRTVNFLAIISIFISGAGAAIGTEYLQSLTGYRSYEITDIYADMTGLVIGSIATTLFTLVRKPHLKTRTDEN